MLKLKDQRESALLDLFMERTADLNEDEAISLNFLRAREGNLDQAEDMLRKSVKWRADNNVGQYLHWELPSRFTKEFQIDFKFTGFDNEGRPVIYVPLGNYKSKECMENGFKDVLFPKLYYHVFEKATYLARQNHTSQAIFILDCNHLSMRQVFHRESVMNAYNGCQMLEQHYPGILKDLIVINAPKIFSIAFKIVRPVMSAHTLSAIQVFGFNKEVWMAELLTKIPSESLPQFMLD